MTLESFEQIRPERFRESQLLAVESDVKLLLSRQAEFVLVPCPGCGRVPEASGREYMKQGFRFVICQVCSCFFMSPRPSIEVLDWFYTESLNYKYWVEHIYPSSAEERKVLIAKPNLDFLLRFCRENGRELRKESVLLEIGAGVGTFAQVARDSGIFRHVLVVEPNPASLQSCVDKGLQAYPSIDALIADFDPECFDVVCAFEVIEHLFDPKEFLLFSRRLLTPRGLFFLTTPCFCSFEVLLNGLLSTTIDHEHLQLFSPASFSELIERSKYQIYSLETSGRLDVSLVKNQLRNYRELESDFGAENFVRHLMTRNPEVLAEFQKFLRYAGLAGNLRALFGRTDSSI